MATNLPDAVIKQINQGLDTYRTPLRDARKHGVSEGDTGLLVHGMLADVFGYDRFHEITSEFKIKGNFADFAIKLDGKVTVIVEVKAIGVKLNDQHIFQASSYAAQEGVDWVVLTNGSQWNLYRVEFTKPVNTTKVLTLEFIDGTPNLDELILVHHFGMQKGVAESFWQRMRALSAANLVKALLDDTVLRELGAHIRRTTNLRVDVAELRERLIADVLKEGLVGQVSLTDIGSAPVSEPAPSRRVRVSHLLSAGLLRPGERLMGDWNGEQVEVVVLASGALAHGEQEVPNLYEATRIVTGGTGRGDWEFWRSEAGESLKDLRERFILGA